MQLYDACKCAEPIHRHCLQGWLAARDASTDGRRRCEVCDQPIALAERVCVEVPLPSAAQLKAVGIKRFPMLCGFKGCRFAGKATHYHCVSGHEMGGRRCQCAPPSHSPKRRGLC